MSVQAQAWALRQSVGSPTAKLVLIALANYANDDGTAHPSLATLARDSELSVRSVRRLLHVLEVGGYIARAPSFYSNGGRSADRYELAVESAPLRRAPAPPPDKKSPPRGATVIGVHEWQEATAEEAAGYNLSSEHDVDLQDDFSAPPDRLAAPPDNVSPPPAKLSGGSNEGRIYDEGGIHDERRDLLSGGVVVDASSTEEPTETTTNLAIPRVGRARKERKKAAAKNGAEPQAAEVPAVKAWSQRACDIWISRFGGTAPGGRIGKALKPLVAKYGQDEVLSVWQRYLAEKDAEFATPQDFAQHYLAVQDGSLWKRRSYDPEEAREQARRERDDREWDAWIEKQQAEMVYGPPRPD